MGFTYRVATEEDRDQYIDFANLVFSMAHEPHDFKALLPKVYGDGKKTAHMQNLALDDGGKIRGLIAVMPGEMTVMGETLRTGYVGTVSVHPYARGEGHMKKLMKMALDGMRARGCDLSMLGGQRQRYEYFGYTRGGISHGYAVTTTNIRHALSNVDTSDIEIREISAGDHEAIGAACAMHAKKPCRGTRNPADFYDIATSWRAKFMGIYKTGAMVGYMIVGWNGDECPITEMMLTDWTYTGAVMKKYFAVSGAKEIRTVCADDETGLRRELARFAEYSIIRAGQQLAIFNFPKVIGTFLKLKASYAPLADGVCAYVIDGQPITISVKANEVTVTNKASGDAKPITALDAQHLFFGQDGNLFGEQLPLGWAPLPLYLDNADGF